MPNDVGVGMLSGRFNAGVRRLLRGSHPMTICYGDKEHDHGTTGVLMGGKFGICGLSGNVLS